MKQARIVLVVVFLGLMALFFGLRSGKDKPSPLHDAIILQRVQSLGELHTAKYSYQDIFTHETNLEPAAWIGYVPGGASLVESATRNRALASAVGSVEAGVDLSKATVSRTRNGIVVVLPAPMIFEPSVRASLHDSKRGLFWRDENLGLKASDAAKQRMREAALRQGILEQASREATRVVTELLKPIGEPVEVKASA